MTHGIFLSVAVLSSVVFLRTGGVSERRPLVLLWGPGGDVSAGRHSRGRDAIDSIGGYVTDATKGVEDREALVGRATGAMVMAVFGLLWALGCAGMLAPILLASSVVVTAILVAAALRLRRAAAGRPSLSRAGTSAAHRVRRRFRLIGIVEGLGIGIVVFVCLRLGRPEFIPALVALVVGLHFFPLAPLFRVSLYHVTGAGLCLVAAATPIAALSVGAPTAWQVVPGLGAAAVLWSTSAVLVVGGLESIRRGI